MYTLNIFFEFNCAPLFLKELKWRDIDLNIRIDNRNKNFLSMSENLRKIVSNLNNNEIEGNETNENIKDIILKLYGYIYYNYFRNKIKYLMSNDDLFVDSIKKLIKEKMIKINDLIKNKLIEKNKIIELFSLVIENETTIDGLKEVCNELNLIEFLKIINENYYLIKNKIIEINKKKLIPWWPKNEIEFENINEKDDINETFILLKQYLEKIKGEEMKIINLDDLIIKINKVNENNYNLNNLIKLRDEVKFLQEQNEVKFDTLFKIYESIHDVGISLFTTKKCSNEQIIQFIKTDIFYTSDEYNEHSKRDPNIFKNFDIFDTNKSGFNDFIQLKIYSKFSKKEKKFNEIFINKIRTLNDLNILFELFPKNQLSFDFVDMLLKNLENIANRTYNINNEEKLFENMYIIVINMIRNKNSISKFTNVIKRPRIFCSNKRITNIYIYILTKNDKEINNNENIINEFVEYFINKLYEINPNRIYTIISKCISNKKFLIKIFDDKRMTDCFIYNEDDIYSLGISPKLNLYKLFIENKFIDDTEFLKTRYFDNIIGLNNKIFFDMKELNIKFLKISKLINEYHEKEFLMKLKLFFINNKNEIDETFKNICDNLKKCQNKFSVLERIRRYLITFERNSGRKIIDNIRKITNTLREKEIKDILVEKETEKIEGFDILIEKSKFLRFKDSIIFMLIYDGLLNEKIRHIESELFNEALEKYKNIIKKIINYKNEIFLKIEKIESILKLLKSKENEIDSEMKFISEEFNNDLNEKKETIDNIKQILMNFSYLKKLKEYINGIDWLLQTFKELKKNSKIEDTEFTANLTKVKDALLSNNDNIKGEDVENGAKILADIGINIKEENNFNILILKLHGKKEEIKFCVGKKDEDIKNLNEYLIDRQSESGNLQPEDFDDFIGSKKYVNEIIESDIPNDKELFNLLKNKFNSDYNLILKFDNYLEKYGEIRELFDFSISDKSEITKAIIQKIMTNSNISIIKEGINFKFKGVYENHEFDLEKLLELKNKSLFVQNTIKDDEKYKEQITQFKSKVENIKRLSRDIQKLISSGYPSNILIELKIENNKLKNGNQNEQNGQTAKYIFNKYQNLFKEFEKELINSYNTKPLLRFFYGPLFLEVIEKINKQKEIEFLLKAISNGMINKLPENGKYQVKENLNFSEIFNIINNYLEDCFRLNDLNLEKIFEKNKIISGIKGLHAFPIIQNLEKNLLLLYKQFTNNFPLSNTVLYCNEYTSLEEIRAFLFLSFKCEYKILFCLLGLENLDIQKRRRTISEIKKLNNEYRNDMQSCLIIIYYKNSEINEALSEIKPEIKNIILDDDKNEIKYENNSIEIFNSELTGFGKSEEIKRRIEQEKKEYIYFPIGGDFSLKKIIERLIELNIPQTEIKNYVLHLDLAETNLVKLLKEILLKILILKKLDLNEQIFYFGELNIKIELPNGFYNYIDKFPIFSIFNITTLKTLTPLFFPKNDIRNSAIYIVADTLKKYKEGIIGKENIDLEKDQDIPIEQCEKIIDEYINTKENKLNYHQKISYIKLLSDEFKKFRDLYILKPSSFDPGDPNLGALDKSRNQIIKSILDSSVFFVKGPYDNLIKSQTISQQTLEHYDEDKQNEQAIESLKNTKDNVTFDTIPGTLFFFNDDKSTFTTICKQEKGTEEYNKYLNLYKAQYGGDQIVINELQEYKNQSHRFYLNELKKIMDLKEVNFSEEEIKELNEKIKEETKEELTSDIYNPDINEDRKLYMEKLCKLNGNYIYTRDNFIKSVIILKKIEASIPVILMGETGCGKTSLLKMLSIFFNKGLDKMKILNIHAGINDEDIIQFINQIISDLKEYLKNLSEIMKKLMEQYDKDTLSKIQDKEKAKSLRENYQKEMEKKLKEEKIWVFFDELNTCNSMGLLSEIMCKRTMLGKPLPENLVFLGAANPYLKMTKQMINSGLTYYTDKISKSNLLVYTVNPMPHTLMNFIFNFSSLNENEEREYIKSMIQQNIFKHYSNKADEECKKLINITLDSICYCHKFMRENYGVASVSLREIRRFNIFFDFFVDYLKNKSIYKNNYQKTYDLLLSTLNLTLFLCYYLRIAEKNIRQELNNKLSEFFPDKEFLIIPNKEMTYISEQFIIDTEKGIALNRSLKENLFTSFVCIVNRIPLIIVGKPGEGKTLTIQTINNTMKGQYSKSDLFKSYPQLFMYKYQGSETSTSQGIIETFKKTRLYAEKQKYRVEQEAKNSKDGIYKEKFIAMVFFDELGLAERSPNNPLKAIHSQLEYDENKFKIAFVGISNWKIDASKMNRALTLSKPDPDKDDILNTADIIAKAIDNTLANKYKALINALALSYYNYKESINNNDTLTKNFHGNRDFYHLIKCAMRLLIKEKEKLNNINDLNEDEDKIIINIAVKSLTRNFGGLNDSINSIISEFKNNYKKFEDDYYKYNILECIKDNLNDYNSRFLMLVADSTIMKYLENVLYSQQKNYIFMTGSKFRLDKKAAEKGGGYSEDLLNKIQFLMSRDNVVILKNLEVIYPSLYELFNQNYIIIGDKYFSKIAFANSKTSSEVNKKFRVILLVTKEKLNKMRIDPPLLNRFEKQIISFQDSLNDEQIELAKEISNSLEKIKTFNNKEKKLVYNLPDLLINCSKNEIEGLIYKICRENEDKINDKDFIENEILKIIVPTFCQDIIASVKYSGFNVGKNENFANKIIDIYKKREINNFEQFLQKIKKNKNVVYTFSHIFENIFPENNHFKYNEIDVEVILSENQVEEIVAKSYEEKNNFLIIHFLEKNLDKMDNISYVINNYEAKYINRNKNNNQIQLKIIFLVHLNRKLNSNKNEKSVIATEELISNLDESYDVIFIDNLKSERNDFINILNISDSTELINSIITNFDLFFDKILNKIISYLDYTFLNKFSPIDLKQYTDIILTKLVLNKNDPFVKFLRKNLIEFTLKNVNKIEFIPKVFTAKVFQKDDVDFFQVLETYISSELSNKLLSIVIYIEKHGVFSCLLVNEKNGDIINNEIIMKQIEELFDVDISLQKKPLSQLRANKINIYSDLFIPSCTIWFKSIIIKYIQNQKVDIEYMKNEDRFRTRQKLEDEEHEIKNYIIKYNDLVKGTKVEFSKNNNIRDIFTQDDKNFKEILFNDYLNFYLIELTNKFSISIDEKTNPINFLNLILQLKFNILCDDNISEESEFKFKEKYIESLDEFDLEKFAEIFLFLESYKNDIIYLIEMYCLLNSKIDNLYTTIKDIIEAKEITTEISNRNPYYKKRVNEIFFIILESLLKSVYKNKDNICSLNDDEFYPFFDSLTLVEATLNKINQKFLLYSNEIYSLRNILSLYKLFKNDSDIKNIMKNIITIIEKDNEELQNKNFNKLKNNISQIKHIIEQKFGNDSDELADYMSNLLREQYRKIEDEDYKFDLLKFAFENDKLIQRSLYFIEQTIKLPIPIFQAKKGKKNTKHIFDKKEECEKYFLNFVNKKDDKILSFFEKIRSETFNQVLLYYFELIANNYFNEIKNKYQTKNTRNLNDKSKEECEKLILEINLSFFNKALNFLDNIFENRNIDNNNLNNLGRIYSIAYIKLYMKYLADIFINNNDIIDLKPIVEIMSSKNNNVRKVVKIFFFKNCLTHFENYSKFKEHIIKDEIFGKIYNEILESGKNDKKENYILNYNFMPNNDYSESYLKSLLQFTNIRKNNFEKLNSFITTEFLDNNGYDLLFCILINHLISFFYSAEKDESINALNILKTEFNKISNNLGMSQLSMNLFNILFNINELITSTKLKKDFTQEQFEILMNSFRYVLLISQSDNNNFYYNLLTQQINEYIQNNYIIGTFPYNNIVVNSYYDLCDIQKFSDPSTGYYVCTCGQCYALQNCTMPGEVHICKNCKRQIGGTNHKLLGSEVGQTDHYRIALNDNDKNICINNGIPYLFLDEYKRKYVDKYLNEQPKGIKGEDEILILIKRYDKVRTLDELTFRILNYILYSHFFFSNLLGYLSDENLKAYIHPNYSCIDMINKNWEIIQIILNEKGIGDAKIFMNIVFNKISNLIKNAENMTTIEKRQEFETSINNCINELINNKEEYEKEEIKYKEYNDKIKGSDALSLIEIISENYSPFENIYSEEEYPYLGLFLLSKYPSLSELEITLGKIKDYTQKYCLLNQVLICDEEFKYLENVVNINKLVELLYMKFNNKISRDQAKNKKLLDCFEQSEINDVKENIIIPYIKSWNEIKSKCTTYLCRPEMPVLNITTEHTLNYFLPDDGELGGGMYLTSGYTHFISLQNGFINNIINSIGPNSLLKSYFLQLNQEIKIQDATEGDIVKINESTLKKVSDLIMKYSMRDIFKKNKIDFKGFKMPIKYDFDSIECELARQILPGVKKFVSSEKKEPIKFITYLYEAFRGKRSSILDNYNSKYPPRALKIEEEKLLYEFININNRHNNRQNFIVDVLSSCQILIDYIQKENYEQNKSICSVIKELPEYIDIDETFKYFFTNIGDKKLNSENENNNDLKMFSINTLINIYNLIELICWEQFRNNLNEQYQMPLSEENKRKIKSIIDNSIKENSLIKKQDIANATRRLISRYLSGKRGDTDIWEYQKLFDQIRRADLWDTASTDNFLYELTDIFENKIKKGINNLIKCDENNKCEWCEIKKNEDGFEEPCFKCNKCTGELLIGHSLDFFELINEDFFDPDKFNKSEKIKQSNENSNENTRRNINTTSQTNERNQNEELIRENEDNEEENNVYEDDDEDDDYDEI